MVPMKMATMASMATIAPLPPSSAKIVSLDSPPAAAGFVATITPRISSQAEAIAIPPRVYQKTLLVEVFSGR